MAHVWSWGPNSSTYGNTACTDGQITTSDGNTIGTPASFGIASLTSATYVTTGKKSTTANESTDRLQWYYQCASFASLEYYVRFYFLFPTGFQMNNSFAAGSMKFCRINSVGGVANAVDAVFKLAEQGGPNGNNPFNIGLQAGLQHVPPAINAEFVAGPVSRDVWHIIEFYVKQQAGADIVKAWFDVDARTAPATYTNTTADWADPTNLFNSVETNGNYSGGNGWIQQWYLAAFAVDNSTAIGDTLGLLGSSPVIPDAHRQMGRMVGWYTQ